jgi:hypothetical protein
MKSASQLNNAKYPNKRSNTNYPPKHKSNQTCLLKSSEYIMAVRDLQKEYNVWYSSGQYLLANEANRRLQCIFKGNAEGYKNQRHSEDITIKTKRMLAPSEINSYIQPTYNKIHVN